VITAGVLVGSLLLYLLVRRFRWVVRRFGRFIQLDEARLKGLEGWFARFGVAIIIPGRLIPGLRIPTTVVSSTFGVPLPFFSLAVAVAAIIWGAFFLALGLAGLGVVRVGKALIPDAPLEWVAWILAIAALVALTLAIRRHFIRAHSR
jgi:membrane protein DedA with SNARE-associated domain